MFWIGVPVTQGGEDERLALPGECVPALDAVAGC